MRTHEWSTRASPDPPVELQAKVDRVVSLVRTLASTPDNASGITVPDRPRTVTVLGGRGQGKSSTLAFAVDRLATLGHLVIPIVDPELFAPGDTLFGYVLAHLERQLPAAVLDSETGRDVTVRRMLNDLSRGQALVASRYRQGLAQRGVTPEEYMRDAVRVPQEGARLSDTWAALVDIVAQTLGHNDLQLIVPVDDADLNPSLLSLILADAQVLGMSQRVVLMMAVDLTVLRQALTVSMLSEESQAQRTALDHGIVSVQAVKDLVDRKIVKHFPRSLRVWVEDVPPPSRLSFRPFNKVVTLAGLLRSFVVTGRTGMESLEDFFVIRTTSGEPVGLTDYTECLSDNRRDLRQLYEALEQIDPGAPQASARALTLLIQHGLDCSPSAPHASTSELIQLYDPTDDRSVSDGPGVAFWLESLAFARTVGWGTAIWSWTGPGPAPLGIEVLTAREIDEFHSWPAAPETPAETDEQKPPQSGPQQATLPGSLTHLLLLAWEGVQYRGASGHLLRLVDQRGRVALPGGRNWRNHVHGDRTRFTGDWRYWTVPEWECHSDYFVLALGWNNIRKACADEQVTTDRVAVLELMMLTHIDLILAVQRDRRVPDGIATMDAAEIVRLTDAAQWPTERSATMDRIEAELVRCMADARQSEVQRNVDFLNWVGMLLPFMAIRLTATAELSDWILRLWHQHGDSVRAQERVAELVALDANEHINDERADAEIELLTQLDPARALSLQDIRDVLSRRLEAGRRNITQQMQNANVPAETILRLEQEGATPELLSTLYAMNYGPQDLASISTVFPAVRRDPMGGRRDDPDEPGIAREGGRG